MNPREIHLTKNRRFVFDYSNGMFRVAWYQSAGQRCERCNLTCTFQQQMRCRHVLNLPLTAKTRRTAGIASTLEKAIANARGEEYPSLDTAFIVEYIARTEWGCKLPGLGGFHAVDPELFERDPAKELAS